MTEFCALAIKSTLIPPITTFKRKKEVESGWKDLREKFQFSLAFFCTVLKSLLIYRVKACAFFGWLDTGLCTSILKEWKSLLRISEL